MRRSTWTRTRSTAPFTPVVVNTGSKLVVIDTGLGPAQYEQSKGAVGQFHANLAAAGIDRNAVDAVIISHFHGDHINGLLTADSKPAFPNAEIMVPAAEWKYWIGRWRDEQGAAGSALEGNFKNIRRVFGALGNKVTQYEPGKELVPGITSMATYGHTPGHTSHVVASGSAKVMVQADVTATSPCCSCATRAGTRCSTWTAAWRSRPAASSTTWRPPRRC